MAKEILWDSRAAKRITDVKLDKHFRKQKGHYKKLAGEAWENLKAINKTPNLLKHDDLYDVLLPVLERDAITLQGFDKLGLPAPGERLWNQWHTWFTNYVVEQYRTVP